MTIVFPIRLNEQEHANLRELAASSGADNISEFVRLLFHREFNRRRGIGKPLPSDYRSAFRVGGRPRKTFSSAVR